MSTNVMHVTRTYTMVRIFCPQIKDNPIQTIIFDDDEWDALQELLFKCNESGTQYEVEILRPH